MLTSQICLVWCTLSISTLYTNGFHCLNLRIPIEHHQIFLQVCGGFFLDWIWGFDRGDGAKPTEGVTELGADAIDLFFKAYCFERPSTKVLDDRQNELDAIFVGRQPLFFEKVAELCHVICPDSKYMKCLERIDMRGPL